MQTCLAIFVWTLHDAIGLSVTILMLLVFAGYCAYLYIGYLIERFACWRQCRRWDRIARDLDRQKQLDMRFKEKIADAINAQDGCPHQRLDMEGICRACGKDCRGSVR